MTPKVRAALPCNRTTAPIWTVLAASASIMPQTSGPATEITRPMHGPASISGARSGSLQVGAPVLAGGVGGRLGSGLRSAARAVAV
jgi:hypothetical protein